MLTGTNTSSTRGRLRRSTPTATNVAIATACSGPSRTRTSGSAILTAAAMITPAAAAARPESTPWISGNAPKRRYAVPAAIISATDGPSNPTTQASAPGVPRIRAPNTAQRLTMLGPGRNWHNARRSLNSCAVIQPLFSTSIRRAHASTPPKLDIERPAKARNNAAMEGREAATTAEGASGSAGGTAEGVESGMPQRLTPDVIDGQTVH